MQVTLSDGVYVNTVNLQPRIQNQLRRMAAFSNPVFYKKQAMGLSNFENYRYIYLGSDEGGCVKVPRGILENITEACEKAGIEYEIEDKRSKGHPIHVEFIGKLKESQIPAVEKLLQYDNGILNAATAFGKTVVCCNIIARRQVSTLILIQSSALMGQWREALEKFCILMRNCRSTKRLQAVKRNEKVLSESYRELTIRLRELLISRWSVRSVRMVNTTGG